MAILQRSTFALVLAALLVPSSYGQVRNFDECKCDNERLRSTDCDGGTLESNYEGSQRRTFGNLCAGTVTARQLAQTGSNNEDKDIDSRNGHPFRTFCDFISDNPRVLNLMAEGTDYHTVFAPTDAAFRAIPGVIGLLGAGGTARLVELHILPEALLTDDLRCGETRKTIDDGILQAAVAPRLRQRSRTRCVSAGRQVQLGPGNSVTGTQPVIGQSRFIFKRDEFRYQLQFTEVSYQSNNGGSSNTDDDYISSDVIACNGVIQVVDQVLLPGNNNRNGRGRGRYGNYGNGKQGNRGYGKVGNRNNNRNINSYGGGGNRNSGNRNSYSGNRNSYGYGYGGGKVGKNSYNGGYYSNNRRGYNRKLGNDADVEDFQHADETENHAFEEPADANSEEEIANRMRRLTAYLESDGNIAMR